MLTGLVGAQIDSEYNTRSTFDHRLVVKFDDGSGKSYYGHEVKFDNVEWDKESLNGADGVPFDKVRISLSAKVDAKTADQLMTALAGVFGEFREQE